MFYTMSSNQPPGLTSEQRPGPGVAGSQPKKMISWLERHDKSIKYHQRSSTIINYNIYIYILQVSATIIYCCLTSHIGLSDKRLPKNPVVYHHSPHWIVIWGVNPIFRYTHISSQVAETDPLPILPRKISMYR